MNASRFIHRTQLHPYKREHQKMLRMLLPRWMRLLAQKKPHKNAKKKPSRHLINAHLRYWL